MALRLVFVVVVVTRAGGGGIRPLAQAREPAFCCGATHRALASSRAEPLLTYPSPARPHCQGSLVPEAKSRVRRGSAAWPESSSKATFPYLISCALAPLARWALIIHV